MEDELAPRIRATLLRLLKARRDPGSLCPGEAARAIARETGHAWRDLMRPVRRVAATLAAEGAIEALQRGQPVDLATARGPIRLRMRRPPPS